jgi:predicted dehydrogenase
MSGKADYRLSGRRQFLKGTLAACACVAIPAVVPAGVFGANSPSNRITIGAIGTGNQGPNNIKAFRSKSEAQVVAVCDVDREFMINAARLVNLPPQDAYTDFRELVARDDVDAVVISTPDHWHVLIAMAAIQAGKDVYCEKPLSFCIVEGRALCDAVARHEAVLQVGTQQRSDRRFRYACELARNGYIGELETIRVEIPENSRSNPTQWEVSQAPKQLEYDLWLGPAPYRPYIELGCHYRWHFLYDFGLGQITNWGAHMVDIAQWGNGTQYTGPVEIEGRGIYPGEGLFETPLDYDIVYTYANGVRLHVTTCRPDGPETGVRFEGSEGWIFVSRERIEGEPISILKTIIGSGQIQLYRSIDHHQNFLDCVRNRSTPAAPVEVGHRTATVCQIGDISIRLGRKLNWDPAKELFIGDTEANKLKLRSMRQPWRL